MNYSVYSVVDVDVDLHVDYQKSSKIPKERSKSKLPPFCIDPTDSLLPFRSFAHGNNFITETKYIDHHPSPVKISHKLHVQTCRTAEERRGKESNLFLLPILATVGMHALT